MRGSVRVEYQLKPVLLANIFWNLINFQSFPRQRWWEKRIHNNPKKLLICSTIYLNAFSIIYGINRTRITHEVSKQGLVLISISHALNPRSIIKSSPNIYKTLLEMQQKRLLRSNFAFVLGRSYYKQI